jgi:hypothetical protein
MAHYQLQAPVQTQELLVGLRALSHNLVELRHGAHGLGVLFNSA